MKKYLYSYIINDQYLTLWPDNIKCKYSKHIGKSGAVTFEEDDVAREFFLEDLTRQSLGVFKFESWKVSGRELFDFEYYYLIVKDNTNLWPLSGIDRSSSCGYGGVCENGSVQKSNLSFKRNTIKKLDIQEAFIGNPKIILISKRFKDILESSGATGFKVKDINEENESFFQLELTGKTNGPLIVEGGSLTTCLQCGVVKGYLFSERQLFRRNSLANYDIQCVNQIQHEGKIYKTVFSTLIMSNYMLKLIIDNKLTGLVNACVDPEIKFMPVIVGRTGHLV